MALSIEKTRNRLKESGLIEMKYPFTLENGEPILIDDILLPMKCKDEQVLWYHKLDSCVFNKTLTAYEALTEYRYYFYNLKEQMDFVIPLTEGMIKKIFQKMNF